MPTLPAGRGIISTLDPVRPFWLCMVRGCYAPAIFVSPPSCPRRKGHKMKISGKNKAKVNAMVKATYLDTTFNKAVSDIPAHTPEFKTYVEQTAAIMDELPGKFGATLAYHMDKLHLTNEALAGLCLINEDTIRKYRNGSNKSKPNIQTVVALCVGLQLPLPFSLDLVHKAGHTFAGEPNDIAYLMILSTMTGCSIYDCNALLRNAGVPPIAKEK